MNDEVAGQFGGNSVVPPVLFSRVLVVSGSVVFRELLRLILVPHSENVLVAGDRKQGIDQLLEFNPIDIVLCDVDLPDGDGFELLEDIAAIVEAKSEVILIANQRIENDALRAVQQGAVGYLSKPVSFRHIAGALKRHVSRVNPRAERRRPGGRVCLLGIEDQIGTPEAAHPQLLWYARDLSISGAFLETESPLPIGSKLDLAIDLGSMRLRVKAEVVRVQEPIWGCGGGVGVAFTECGELAREAIRAYVNEGGADSY